MKKLLLIATTALSLNASFFGLSNSTETVLSSNTDVVCHNISISVGTYEYVNSKQKRIIKIESGRKLIYNISTGNAFNRGMCEIVLKRK